MDETWRDHLTDEEIIRLGAIDAELMALSAERRRIWRRAYCRLQRTKPAVKDREREKNRSWRKRNPEKRKAAQARWRERHADLANAAARRYREAHPDRVKEANTRQMLARRMGVRPDEVPHDLVAAKVAQLRAAGIIRRGP